MSKHESVSTGFPWEPTGEEKEARSQLRVLMLRQVKLETELSNTGSRIRALQRWLDEHEKAQRRADDNGD